MTLKNKIKTLKESGMSYSYIAKLAKVHRSTIARYMRNEFELSEQKMQEIELVVDKLIRGIN